MAKHNDKRKKKSVTPPSAKKPGIKGRKTKGKKRKESVNRLRTPKGK